MKNIIHALFFVIIFTSCSLFVNENDGYEQALEKWEENKIPNYEFSYNVGCFCPQLTPALIVVNSDSVYQVLESGTRDSLFIQTGESTFEYAGDIYKSFYYTIDGLFEVVKNARGDAYKLNVEYNNDIGFPESIDIDYIKNAIDDEIGYSVSDYRPYLVKTF